MNNPWSQQLLRIFSYKGEQYGFVLHHVIDTEKYIKQTQFLKEYIKKLKGTMEIQ